jgi:hypothetical protein
LLKCRNVYLKEGCFMKDPGKMGQRYRDPGQMGDPGGMGTKNKKDPGRVGRDLSYDPPMGG